MLAAALDLSDRISEAHAEEIFFLAANPHQHLCRNTAIHEHERRGVPDWRLSPHRTARLKQRPKNICLRQCDQASGELVDVSSGSTGDQMQSSTHVGLASISRPILGKS